MEEESPCIIGLVVPGPSHTSGSTPSFQSLPQCMNTSGGLICIECEELVLTLPFLT